MSSNVNRADVLVSLRDAHGRPIEDDADPYDIHQILVHFQSHLGVVPGYDLL